MNELNFEEKLKQMTKHDIEQLKHQNMLGNAISSAKDKSVVSWWWLSIPLFITAMLWMKSVYMPQTSMISNIHDLISKQKFLSAVVFLVLPIALMILNSVSIRKIYFMSGSPRTISFLLVVWFNVLMILLSIPVLIIYSL